MKSYMLSSLAVQVAAKGVAAFRSLHPHDWLVWEPGSWRPPRNQTLIVPSGPVDPVKSGEALALAMEPKAESPGVVTLGRATECTLVINDGTLSAMHLCFTRTPEGSWSVQDAGSTNGSKLDGVELKPGQDHLLRSGARFNAAQVSLTFYSPDGLLERMAKGS